MAGELRNVIVRR